MLLTGGQISMAVTSSVVFLFTTLLFLSGYVLQQQTVRNMQAIIHPTPPPKPSPPPEPVRKKHLKLFGRPSGEALDVEDPKWSRLAYAQLGHSHMHVCDSLMMFAALKHSKSSAKRVYLYPREWEEMDGSGADAEKERSMRMIRKARARYGVEIFPIDPLMDSDSASSAYPIEGLLALIQYERILVPQPSGLLLNITISDTILEAVSQHPIAATSRHPGAFILQPNELSAQNAMTRLRLDSDSAVIRTRVYPLLDSDVADVIVDSSKLRSLPSTYFNGTQLAEMAAYVRLDDFNDLALGPYHDVPRSLKSKARPRDTEVRDIWEDLYETYRFQRMDICGLDLEPVFEAT
ncbi:hypothetical protein MMC25_003569 [Agyrium rufum]|nr:hypothetical protein [Agyrium rufum]